MRFALILFSLVSSLSAFAEVDPCNDLYAATCEPTRSHNDGTNSFETRTTDQVYDVFEGLMNGPAGSRIFDREISRLVDSPRSGADEHLLRNCHLDSDPQFKICFTPEGGASRSFPSCRPKLMALMSAVFKNRLTGFALPESCRSLTDSELADIFTLDINTEALKKIGAGIEELSKTPERQASIRRPYDAIKAEFIKLIPQLPLSPSERDMMIRRVTAMSLRMSDCQSTLEPFAPNAFYDSLKNEMNVCASFMLSTDSLFTIVSALSHEMGHAFNRCAMNPASPIKLVADNYTDQLVNQFDRGQSLPTLVACQRNAAGTNARVCAIDGLKCDFADPNARTGCSLRRSIAPVSINACGGDLPPHDQADEAMADWFSAHILTSVIQTLRPQTTPAEWRTGLQNANTTICQTPEMIANVTASANSRRYACDPHPLSATRINSIYATTPAIRRRLACATPEPHFTACEVLDSTRTGDAAASGHDTNRAGGRR